MKILVLSHFDTLMGPRVKLVAPPSFKNKDLIRIANLMDLQIKGFFLHEFEDYSTGNLQFEINNPYARGKVESFMISIVLIDEEPKSKLLDNTLQSFVSEFKKLDEPWLAFSNEDKEIAAKKSKEIKRFFYRFQKSLPKETVFTKQRNASLLIFGLDKAGKTTIINRLKENIFSNPKQTTNFNIVNLVFGSMSFVVYDTAGQRNYRSLWSAHLRNQDALIFTLDVTDDSRYKEAARELHRVTKKPELEKIPLLILFNKVDLKKPRVKKIAKQLGIKKIKDRPKKIFLTSAKTNKGVWEAFEWLAAELVNKMMFNRS